MAGAHRTRLATRPAREPRRARVRPLARGTRSGHGRPPPGGIREPSRISGSVGEREWARIGGTDMGTLSVVAVVAIGFAILEIATEIASWRR